jgi:hypothetical protein
MSEKKRRDVLFVTEPTMMFFGMCNSPATFQAMMDNIFIMMIDN